MNLIDIVAGARPNFMKIAPIIEALETNAAAEIEYRLIHTGQHYDRAMSESFFEQLGIPEPAVDIRTPSNKRFRDRVNKEYFSDSNT